MATLDFLKISSFPRFQGKHSLTDIKSSRAIKCFINNSPYPRKSPCHVTARAFGRREEEEEEDRTLFPRANRATTLAKGRPKSASWAKHQSDSEDSSNSDPDSAALERKLSVAISEENYKEAAKIRDALKALGEDEKGLVLAANERFYSAFRAGDLAAMRAQWAQTEEACCVHPGSRGISGHEDVVTSWEYIWANYDFPLEIELRDVKARVRGHLAYVTCVELVRTKGSSWGGQFVTNVFERLGDHWLISVHHASPIDL